MSVEVRGIVFDVDGTLYRQTRVRAAMVGELLSDAARLRRGLVRDIRIISSFRHVREELRSLPPGSGIESLQYELVGNKLGLTAARVREAVRSLIYDRPLPILREASDARTTDAMRRLRDAGYRLGIYSDYPAADKLAALGFDHKLFDIIADSEMPEIDVFKPNPAGFLYTASRMGLDPAEVMYVGDRVRVDMEGARRAGMRGALVTWSSRRREPGDGYVFVRDTAALADFLGAG